jgi:hypothetical protein
LKLKVYERELHTSMNALLHKECGLKDINAGQQLESKVFIVDENKVSFSGTQ